MMRIRYTNALNGGILVRLRIARSFDLTFCRSIQTEHKPDN